MYYVPLSFIEPNPWQPRKHIDTESISELADSIRSHAENRPATFGLLQTPAGRLVDGDLKKLPPAGNIGEWLMDNQACVQLAFGHRRLAAFRLLDQGLLPVELGNFSDEEMASMAWTENSARKDLTAIEEARFIEKLIADFNLTQDAAAARLTINRSTVANKLRLLKLPEDVQEHIQSGALSGRQAMALLTLYDMTPGVRRAAEMHWDRTVKPTDILASALAGESSDRIRERISHIPQNIEVPESRPVAPVQHADPAPAPEAESHVWPPEQPDQETYPETSRPGLPLQEAPTVSSPDPITHPTPAPVAPIPEPKAEPEKVEPPPSWDKSSITLTITLWPLPDGADLEARPVVIAVRVNQQPPIMKMHKFEDIDISGPMADIFDQVFESYQKFLEGNNANL